MAVVLQDVLHVLIGLLLARAVDAPLLLLLCRVYLVEFGVLTCWLLADGRQSTDHIVDVGQLDLLPHDSELWVHGMEQAGLVQPNVRCAVVLAGSHDQDLVRRLQLVDGLVAVGPAVLEILDLELTGVRLSLQVVEQRRLVLDAGDLGSELVPARPPCRHSLLLQVLDAVGGVRQERDLAVLAQALGEILVKALLRMLQRQMVEDVL